MNKSERYFHLSRCVTLFGTIDAFVYLAQVLAGAPPKEVFETIILVYLPYSCMFLGIVFAFIGLFVSNANDSAHYTKSEKNSSSACDVNTNSNKND